MAWSHQSRTPGLGPEAAGWLGVDRGGPMGGEVAVKGPGQDEVVQ